MAWKRKLNAEGKRISADTGKWETGLEFGGGKSGGKKGCSGIKENNGASNYS